MTRTPTITITCPECDEQTRAAVNGWCVIACPHCKAPIERYDAGLLPESYDQGIPAGWPWRVSHYWAHEYRFLLRPAYATDDMRLDVYRAFVAAGLEPGGVSDRHAEIIAQTAQNHVNFDAGLTQP